MKRAALAALLGAAALVTVGWWARDQVLAAGGGLGPMLSVAVGAFGGASIGAGAAWWVARENRAEASRTRFHEDLRRVAADLVQAAERHQKERRQQFESWQAAADAPDGNPIPSVGSTEPIYYAAVTLGLTAPLTTWTAAWALYEATLRLDNDARADPQTYDLAFYDRYRRPDGSVEGPPAAALLAYGPALAAYRAAVLDFVNAVRFELDEETTLALPEY